MTAPDIQTRLDQYVADVLALPYDRQLADLTVAGLLVEAGRHQRDVELGIAPRPQSSRPRHLHIAGTGGAR